MCYRMATLKHSLPGIVIEHIENWTGQVSEAGGRGTPVVNLTTDGQRRHRFIYQEYLRASLFLSLMVVTSYLNDG